MSLNTIFRSLKLQIILALLILALVLTATTIYTRIHFDEQISSGIVLQQAEKLQIAAQRLTIQGMAYKKNPARDYETYNRDIQLYYQDMMSQVHRFDKILQGFIHKKFPPSVTGMNMTAKFTFDPETQAATDDLAKIWTTFKTELDRVQGEDKTMPKIEWGAEYIIRNHGDVDDATSRLIWRIQDRYSAHNKSIRNLNRTIISVAIFGSLLIFIWLVYIIIIPLNRLREEIQPIANGRFNTHISKMHHNELNEVVDVLNHTSSRLDAVFHLIEIIQQSKEPNEILQRVVDSFSQILPINWLGVLFITPDHSAIKMNYSYSDDGKKLFSQSQFAIKNTLLEQAIHSGELIHVASISKQIEADSNYQFLQELHQAGYEEAIFLPLHEQKPFEGILVIASKNPEGYSSEQIELVKNIANLITLTFSRTLTLVESSRLASIGQFTSSIVHELRNPLATVRIALDYLENQDINQNSARRLKLASDETNRITRLLDDILSYAKPIHLHSTSVSIFELLNHFIDAQIPIAAAQNLSISRDLSSYTAMINLDADRIIQVLGNIISNAYDAATDNSDIQISSSITADRQCRICISNQGEPIPQHILDHIFDPFVTNKSNGTGLGLGICKRIIDAHNGSISFESSNEKTSVLILLPINQ